MMLTVTQRRPGEGDEVVEEAGVAGSSAGEELEEGGEDMTMERRMSRD